MHKHQETVEKIFTHPIDMNIDWHRVEHLFEHLGAEVTESSHGNMKVELNGHELAFHRNGKSKQVQSKDEVVELRHFLESVGVTPDSQL
jgi:hypothetical protein